MKASKIVGANGLFEPAHVELCELLIKAQRLLSSICPVCIDEQLHIGTNRFTRNTNPMQILVRTRPDLHLDSFYPACRPSAQLLRELLVRIGSESAATVYCNSVACHSEK